ncbi:MAG: metal-dependent hydrolase [Mariniblastus sp.]
MADFKTHITTSTIIGCVYGGAGFYVFQQPAAHCLIAGSLCSVAGMLPDLDSNSGIPQREMLSFVSVIVPMLMLPRFEALGLTTEHMVFLAGVMYATIRFGVGGLFKRFTKHRGMWHSIPAALIAGMVTFMVCLSTDLEIRLFKSWAVVLGFVSHLVLDEVYAVNWEGKLPKTKKSFGTALKFWGNNQMANLFTYAKFAALIVMIASDDYVMECVCEHPIEPTDTPVGLIKSWFVHDHAHSGIGETFHR